MQKLLDDDVRSLVFSCQASLEFDMRFGFEETKTNSQHISSSRDRSGLNIAKCSKEIASAPWILAVELRRISWRFSVGNNEMFRQGRWRSAIYHFVQAIRPIDWERRIGLNICIPGSFSEPFPGKIRTPTQGE